MTECWRQVPDFPGYEVSDHGRVRSYKKRTGFGQVDIVDTPQRMLSETAGDHYPRVVLASDGASTHIRIHTLVLSAFLGPRPEGMECRHLDSDPHNNHISNLRWGTRAENVQDAIANGTFDGATGAASRRKFTSEQVRQIRRAHWGAGRSQRSLAKEWGASGGAIHKLCVGITYKDCPGPVRARALVDTRSAYQTGE